MRYGTLILGMIAALAVGGPVSAAAWGTFPLAVQPGKRYLVDAAGKPFMIKGDTAWSLIAELRREEVTTYLDDRRSRGFNAILVSLIERFYSSNPPHNAYGDAPFVVADDFATPNEGYFAHADWVLRQAADRGFLVLLTPSYAGAQGGYEGWYQAMLANGPEKLRAYGRYLGKRYRDFSNILWIQGGDYHPPDKDLVRALAEGIQEQDPDALQSAHGGVESSALEHWRGESWLKMNTVYTYGDVRAASTAQWLDASGMPFLFIEGLYENEHQTTERRLRQQAYQALLTGAAGQVFGNNPIWHFDGPGLFDAPTSWRAALGSRGAASMAHLHRLFDGLPWWTLRPDLEGSFLDQADSADDDEPAAALAADGSFALTYVPVPRAIRLDLDRLAGPNVRLRWYDPAEGRVVGPDQVFKSSIGRVQVQTPGANASGFGDWLLIAESF